MKRRRRKFPPSPDFSGNGESTNLLTPLLPKSTINQREEEVMSSVSKSNYHLAGKRPTARSRQTVAALTTALLVIAIASRASANEVAR
jgi:hypothetical protein